MVQCSSEQKLESIKVWLRVSDYQAAHSQTQKKCFYILNRQYFDIMAALLRLQISQCTNHSMCTYVALETLRV